VEIGRAVWTLMERLEVINVRGGGSLTKKGVEAELEVVEEVNRMYPETIAFVKLLATLIHTPKRVSLKDRVNDAAPLNTIPDNLGQPYRQHGISPYVAFVVDEVFLKIPNREYQVPKERWQLNDLCLAFMERCLAAYDLEGLLTSAEEQQIKAEALVPLFIHPGYDILQRLLSNSPLQSSILKYLVDGIEGFERHVVLKRIRPQHAKDQRFIRMFLDEARLAAHLDHSNIVQTMELGVHEARYYMVMEFLAGLSLAMIVRRVAERVPGTRIPVPLVLNMLAQSCAGLHYAHEKAMNGKALNIVHRDISPQNLVISFEGVVKVVDFGIAKAATQVHQTFAGETKGTPSMMAPEQRVGEQVDVPVQLHEVHAVACGHATDVPTQAPAALHESAYVQRLPSLQDLPTNGVTEQEAVPLHVRVLH